MGWGEKIPACVCWVSILGKDPFLGLFQFPFLQQKMWLQSCSCLQKLQATNCREEALNKGGLRLSSGVTRTELELFAGGFLTSRGW